MEVGNDAVLAMLDTNGDGIVDDHELLGGAMAVFDPDGDGVSGNHSPEFATKDERAKVEESKGRQSTKKKKPSEKKSSAKKKKPSVKKAKAKEAEEKKFYKSAFASKQVWTSCSWYMEQFTTDDCRKLLAKSSKGAFVARRPPAAKDEKLSKADVCFSITSGDAAKPVYHVLIKNRVDTSDKKTWYLWYVTFRYINTSNTLLSRPPPPSNIKHKYIPITTILLLHHSSFLINFVSSSLFFFSQGQRPLV